MRYRPAFCAKDWVYDDKKTVVNREEAKSATKDPSRSLVPMKDGPYRVLWVPDHTQTVDIRGIDNVVPTDRVILARTHREAGPAIGISQGERADGNADAEDRPALNDEDANHPQ